MKKGRGEEATKAIAFISHLTAFRTPVGPDIINRLEEAPMQIMINGEWRENQVATVTALLETLRLDARRVAIELNRQLLPRAKFSQTSLADKDVLEIVTLVGGG